MKAGKVSKLQFYVNLQDIIPTPTGYIATAEVSEFKNIKNDYETKPLPMITGLSINPAPYQKYDPFAYSKSFKNRMHNYRRVYAVVLYFNKAGELLWDSGFKINESESIKS